MASSRVAGELCPDRKPLEPQEALLLDKDCTGACYEVLGDEYFDSHVPDGLVSRFVGFSGVGVDRHRCVAASAESGDVVECYRSVTPVQVCSGLICDQYLQFAFVRSSCVLHGQLLNIVSMPVGPVTVQWLWGQGFWGGLMEVAVGGGLQGSK